MRAAFEAIARIWKRFSGNGASTLTTPKRDACIATNVLGSVPISSVSAISASAIMKFGTVRATRRRRDGTQLFVATGQEHHRARYLWDELGFSKHLDGMFYSAEIGFPKKDVRFFAAINRTLGIVASERPLLFDDQPEIVELARCVGWDGTTFTSIKDIQEHPRLSHLLL